MRQANAFPAKSFFVNMLTRDIDLSDAIMDLIDNCVDGIIRTKWSGGIPEGIEQPYDGFKAEIVINKELFRISDNCGGIPQDIAEKYAFRMGRNRVEEDLPTVGVYGIGMKRALFKIGKHSRVISFSNDANFEVVITPEWLTSDDNWILPIENIDGPTMDKGTIIEVTQLYEGISLRFSDKNGFITDLIETIKNHYSFIMIKGFEIRINGDVIKPAPMKLLFETDDNGETLRPYIYSGVINGIDILLEVGFYRPTPTEEELEQEQVIRRSKDEAGWTLICNDRVVVFKDKTILTGWGEANVPSFHSQFNGIAGIVIFRSNNASKLPITTTKRGIDASSEIYLRVKNYMREGMKLFTDYTNKWKKDPEKEREKSNQAESINVLKLPEAIPGPKWRKIPNSETEKRFIPSLPKPNEYNPRRQIRFNRDMKEIKKVSMFLFDDPDKSPAEVGNASFEFVLRRIHE